MIIIDFTTNTQYKIVRWDRPLKKDLILATGEDGVTPHIWEADKDYPENAGAFILERTSLL